MHIIEIELCICALVKPLGQFISGLPFYFWRDMCGNNVDRANQYSQVVCESNAGRYVWYGIGRRLEQFRMRLRLAQYLVLPRPTASTKCCGCDARPGFCVVLEASISGYIFVAV